MHFPQFQVVFILCASTAVYSLPASLLSNSDLLTSGQAAQALNAQFQTLTTSSPCGNLTTGCVSNSIATCTDDTWDTSNACSKGQSCFALPNVRNGGTSLSCTSEKNALSLIEATGATGGITGTDSTGSSSGSTKSKTATANSASITSAFPTATATDTGSDSRDRVTVTVTVDISATTRTISPQEASSIISSITAEGSQATVSSQDSEAESTPCPKMKGMMHKKTKSAVTSVPTPTTTATDDLTTPNAAPGTTITLIAATSPVGSPSAATPTAAATPASDSSSGDSYGGY